MITYQRRKDLTASVRLCIATMAFLHRGVWGAITRLAKDHGISRQMVYMLLWQLQAVFEPLKKQDTPVADTHRHSTQTTVMWDKLVLTLRLQGCCSIGDLSSVLKHLGIADNSVGCISQFLKSTALAIPQTPAIPSDCTYQMIVLADEIFMTSKPVCILLDAKSHYILNIFLAEDRSGNTWASLYESAQNEGISIAYVVADCGEGLRKGCELRGLIHHPDLMHLIYGFAPFLGRFERKAFAAIVTEYERESSISSARSPEVIEKRQLLYKQARQEAENKIWRCDDFSYLWKCLIGAFDLFNSNGTVRTRDGVEQEVMAILELMEKQIADASLNDVIRRFKKAVIAYWPYFDRGQEIYKELQKSLAQDVLDEVCLGWQTQKKAHACKNYQNKKRLQELADQHFFLAHCADMPGLNEKITNAVDHLEGNVRSSSPLEAINSQIRDFINSARGQITPETLNLIAYFLNHKRANRGPYKGSSPYERLCGIKEDDDCFDQILKLINGK